MYISEESRQLKSYAIKRENDQRTFWESTPIKKHAAMQLPKCTGALGPRANSLSNRNDKLEFR